MKRLLNFLFFFFLAIFLVAALVMYAARGAENRRLQAARDELRAKNDRLQHEVNECRKRRTAFEKDPDYVEFVARQDGRARASETVFQFPEPEPPSEPAK